MPNLVDSPVVAQRGIGRYMYVEEKTSRNGILWITLYRQGAAGTAGGR
jgi:hypothetical protein